VQKSPTQRTLALLREDGYLAAVVEHWNPHARVRQDLFGIIDVVAVGNRSTIGVQATSYSNVSARVAKLRDSDTIGRLREAGWSIFVHGWKKDRKSGRWEVRQVDLS
jgi:carbonic anhydrase